MNKPPLNLLLKPFALVALTGVLLVAGCATPDPLPSHFPSTAVAWNGIDSVEFEKEFRLNDYSQLVLEPLDRSTTPLPPEDENTYEPVVNIIEKADAMLLTEVAGTLKGHLEVTTLKADGAVPQNSLLFRGKLSDVHPGSQAARYWGGFGAGAAWVAIDGVVYDSNTGEALLRFRQQRVGSMGAFGGSYTGLLTDCVVEIARDFGRMLTYFEAP